MICATLVTYFVFRCSEEWCNQHFLQHKQLKKADDVRTQLEDIMNHQNLYVTSSGLDLDRVRRAIAAGYFHQAARAKGIGEFLNVRSGLPVFLHPTSALHGLGCIYFYIFVPTF